jgi:phosphatidylglycerol:prolipoprotein diacylglycerol transferase
MLPYIVIDKIDLGFITLRFWGIMVSLGFLIGILASRYLAKQKNIKLDIFDIGIWVILFSMIFGRLFHILFYNFDYYYKHWLDIFKIWQGGLSVFGGFFGALLAVYLYFKIKKIDFWEAGDVLMFGLPLGLFIGRIGCTFIHDHLGILTDFFLGIKYPGGTRHNLGMYHSIQGLILFIIFLLILKFNKYKKGVFIISFLFYYGITRFFLDFLRCEDCQYGDIRYFKLTPGQYMSIIFVILGIIALYVKPWEKKFIRKQNGQS